MVIGFRLEKIIDKGSIHQVICESVIAKLASGLLKTGDKLPSDAMLAKEFGASRPTVIRALERLCAEGIIERRQGMGSFVAMTEANKRSVSIKVIALICGDIRNSFGQRLTVSIEKALRETGYELMLCQHDLNVEREAKLLRNAVRNKVDGIILIPAFPPANAELVAEILKSGGSKLVCVDSGFPGINAPLIKDNHRQGAYEAVTHLIKFGHKRIGFIISSFRKMGCVQTIADSFEGYKKALSENGIPFDMGLVAELGDQLASKNACDVGYRLYSYQPMIKLLRLKNPPTAVFLLWDELAFGAMAAVKDLGLKVPEDISFVGYNDDPLALLTPIPLTTVRQPAEDIGYAAVSILIKLIKGASCPKSVNFDSTLVVRASSGMSHLALEH